MARRLSPEARRAEILEVAQAAIASDGYTALSLREVARRCGMSAPGLMHYFPDMPALLEAVLSHRDETDLAAIFDATGPHASVLDALDVARDYYAARSEEVRNFDALEAEALTPGHPAHDYFQRRSERNFERMRPQIHREFEGPEEVERALRLLFDGVRLKWLRSPDAGEEERARDWQVIRSVVSGFRRKSLS